MDSMNPGRLGSAKPEDHSLFFWLSSGRVRPRLSLSHPLIFCLWDASRSKSPTPAFFRWLGAGRVGMTHTFGAGSPPSAAPPLSSPFNRSTSPHTLFPPGNEGMFQRVSTYHESRRKADIRLAVKVHAGMETGRPPCEKIGGLKHPRLRRPAFHLPACGRRDQAR